MRRHSDVFPIVLTGAVIALLASFKSIYEGAAKAWVLAKLAEHGYGPEAANVMSGFVEITPALGISIGIIWFLYWYIRREFEKKSIRFIRELDISEGEFGYYTAHVLVTNTSLTEKLKDCRCEILELRDGDGSLIQKNIGLRTRGQENKQVQGRFNLDQDSTKDIPIFEIDQSRNDNGLTIINANNWDINLEHGIYTARIRAYGDTGPADEVTIRLDSRDCSFTMLDKAAAASLANERSSTGRLSIDEPPSLSQSRVSLAQLRSEGVALRNTGMNLQTSQGDFDEWEADIAAWLDRVIAEISNIDVADAEWFRILDAVPEARVHLNFPRKHKEGLHIKLHRVLK
jgi:hypothetical protein